LDHAGQRLAEGRKEGRGIVMMLMMMMMDDDGDDESHNTGCIASPFPQL